jgi:hypothetical protein
LKRGRRLWIVLGALACAVALALPAAAPAAEDDLEDALAAFTLTGTHGYSMLVLAAPDLDKPPRVDGQLPGEAIVYVARKPSAVLYVAPTTVRAEFVEGRPTVTSVRINMEALGNIAVDFKPSGGKATAGNKRCGSVVYAPGTYEGSIEFHGEQDFTDVSATTVAQRPEAALNLLCQNTDDDETSGPHLPGAKLEVDKLSLGGNKLSFLALQVNKNRPSAKVHVELGTLEEKGPLEIFRSVEMEAPSGAFSFDRRLRHASLQLGAPFSGRAVYRRDAKPRNRWSGNLTVDLPGRSNVRLTGRGFDPELSHAVRRVTR